MTSFDLQDTMNVLDSSWAFDIVGEYASGPRVVGPEANQRQTVSSIGAEPMSNLCVSTFDQNGFDWPGGKCSGRLPVRICSAK